MKMDNLNEDRSLWVDPLNPIDNRDNPKGPVLLADEIKEYVEKYKILINPNDFNERSLKGASYSMKPDPKEAYYFDEKRKQTNLKRGKDENGSFYIVKRNSLVYIKLSQRLILPYYIIGRHNLTIKYVYQGLLLGTGPQVDPGFEGNLFIPLHNLTNRDVNVYIDKSFVSIDFVRTSPIILHKGEVNSREEFARTYPEYRPISSTKLGRIKLVDYLDGARPSSSLAEFVPRFEKNTKKMEKFLGRKWIDIVLVIAASGVLLASGIGFYQVFISLDTRIDKNIGKIASYEARQATLDTKIKSLSNEINKLDNIKNKILNLETNLPNINIKYDDLASLSRKVNELEERINKVGRETKRAKNGEGSPHIKK